MKTRKILFNYFVILGLAAAATPLYSTTVEYSSRSSWLAAVSGVTTTTFDTTGKPALLSRGQKGNTIGTPTVGDKRRKRELLHGVKVLFLFRGWTPRLRLGESLHWRLRRFPNLLIHGIRR